MSKRSFPIFLLSSLFLIIFLWEWGARAFPHLLFVLPAPSHVLKTIWEIRSRFWLHGCVTLKEMCCGFVLALSLAFPLAWTMIRFKKTRSLLQPFLLVIQCIPMFTLAPIMVVWLGWGYAAIVIPTALMIFFPLTLNIYHGLRTTPQELIEFFEANEATHWQIFYKLQIPWAIPHIFSGIRISAAIAGVSTIAGEWAGAQEGLGVLMLESRQNTDLEITFGALFCLTAISILLYLLVIYIERIALPPRRWNLKGIKPRLTLFISLILLLSSCHGENSEKKRVRLMLDWHPNPNHVPLYVGIEKNFFDEEGMSITIQKIYDGGSGIPYLLGNRTDLLISHLPGTLKACAKGACLKIVGLLIKEPLCGLIYRDDLKIDRPCELSGTIFGYCVGIPELDFVNHILLLGDIKPSSKKNVSVDLVSAMGTKSVDFIYGGFWNIEPCQLRSLGIETKTFKIQDFGIPPYYEMVILAREGSCYGTPAFALSFQRALQKSIDFCKSHPQEAFACFSKYNPDRSSKTVNWQEEAWNLTYPILSENQIIDEAMIEHFYQWQLEHKMIKNSFHYQSLIEFN